jgi:hypothetical protein
VVVKVDVPRIRIIRASLAERPCGVFGVDPSRSAAIRTKSAGGLTNSNVYARFAGCPPPLRVSELL